MNNETNYREKILESIREIKNDDIKKMNFDQKSGPITNIIEEQKVYFWIRLYLNEENAINIGEKIIIKWKQSGEELETQFMAYGKEGLNRDRAEDLVNYVLEDNKKVLTLMVDTKEVDMSDDIPFIRTLFKTSRHYEYRLVKRIDLVFINKETGEELDYYDCDF